MCIVMHFFLLESLNYLVAQAGDGIFLLMGSEIEYDSFDEGAFSFYGVSILLLLIYYWYRTIKGFSDFKKNKDASLI